MDIYDKVRDMLAAISEGAQYAEWSGHLMPGVAVMGVRIPAMRRLARDIAAGDWRGYLTEAQAASRRRQAAGEVEFMEERLMQGLVLGTVKGLPTPEYLELTAAFASRIQSWAECDSYSISESRKRIERDGEAIFSFLQRLARSEREYEARFGIVMLMKYFCTPPYIDRLLDELRTFSHSGYYARMGAAWALAECFIKFPSLTELLFHNAALDSQIRRMAVRKVCDSLRVCDDAKRRLRQSLA